MAFIFLSVKAFLFHFLIVLNTLETDDPIKTVQENGDFILIAMAIWIISLFVVRWRISKHVLYMMNKASKTTVNSEPEVLQTSELKAKNKPTFEDVNKYSNNDEAIQRREQFVRNAYLLFRKKYFYGLIAVLAYIVLPFGLLQLSGESLSDESLGVNIMLIVFYFLLINLNFYFYRKQFRASDAKFGIRFEHPYVTLLRKIVNPYMESILTFVVVFIIFTFSLQELGYIEPTTENFQGNTLFGIGLILACAYHLFSYFKIRRIAQKGPNEALLVLRVFGDKNQTSLTFGKITKFWKHFGSWFTVADPSFIKRQNNFFSFKTVFTLALLFLGAVILGLILDHYFASFIKDIFPDTSDSLISEFLFIPGMVGAWIIYFQYLRFKISRSYAKDIQDIRKKLNKTLKKPRKFDLSFKSLPMFCYDNTWKLAVSEFIKNSKVILMDLRGFNEKRKGCEYEIDFLLDTFPISQILFLADAKNDRSFIQKTILERWEFLREHSPNIRLENPTARIFVIDKQDETDVQSIIDLLIVSIDTSK